MLIRLCRRDQAFCIQDLNYCILIQIALIFAPMTTRHADHIAQELETMLLNGTFADGERLDEMRLAQQFGVSRTPLREAFQRLALSGLVELVPRRGAFARQPGPVELLEMFEVMAEMEAICGRLAAQRITEAAIANLHTINARAQDAVNAQDHDRYYLENEAFHREIYEQSGNGFLAQEAMRLHKRLKPFRRLQLRVRGRMGQSMEEHCEIVEALASGDSNRAGDVLRAHVAVQGEKFHTLMQSFREKPLSA